MARIREGEHAISISAKSPCRSSPECQRHPGERVPGGLLFHISVLINTALRFSWPHGEKKWQASKGGWCSNKNLPIQKTSSECSPQGHRAHFRIVEDYSTPTNSTPFHSKSSLLLFPNIPLHGEAESVCQLMLKSLALLRLLPSRAAGMDGRQLQNSCAWETSISWIKRDLVPIFCLTCILYT